MKIAVCLAPDEALERRAVRRASRALLFAACASAVVCVAGAALVLSDSGKVNGRNAFLAARVARFQSEVRGLEGEPEWKAVREKGAFYATGLRAGGRGVVETLGMLEAALPEGVVLRQLQVSRGGALLAEGASKTLGGGELFRTRFTGTGSRWLLTVENTGYDQSRGEYGFRLKGAPGAR